MTDSLAGPMASAVRDAIGALTDEIRAVRDRGSSGYELTDGQFLHETQGQYLYSFRADVAIALAPDTPVSIVVPKRDPIAGSLIAIEELEVLLALDDDLGSSVERARLTAEPWFILQAMRDLLESRIESPPPSVDLAGALLSLSPWPERRPHVQWQVPPTMPDPPNRAQLAAVNAVLASRLHFVWGPPGTGKTSNLGHSIRALLDEGQRVLVLAHANVAVDVAMLRVAHLCDDLPELERGEILRIGTPQLPQAREHRQIIPEAVIEREQPDLIAKKRSLEQQRRRLVQRLQTTPRSSRAALVAELGRVRAELRVVLDAIREATQRLIARARVLGATLSRYAIDPSISSWAADAVIVDEASMAPMPFVLGAALANPTRFAIFGDFRQLPPVATSTTTASANWLQRDAFDFAGVREAVDRDDDHPGLTMLDTQYRMVRPIADVVSNLAYAGRLQTDEVAHERALAVPPAARWSDAHLVVFDTSELGSICTTEAKPGSYSRFNPLHVGLAIELVQALLDGGVADAGLISPYRAQARLLGLAARDLFPAKTVAAATVHRFQGSERAAVVLDVVDAPFLKGPSNLTGRSLDTARRLVNVAISRAQGRVVLLVDIDFVRAHHRSDSPLLRAIDMFAATGDVVRPAPAQVVGSHPAGGVQFFDSPGAWSGAIADAINLAGERTLLGLSDPSLVTSRLHAALREAQARGVRSTVFAPIDVAQVLEDGDFDLRLLTPAGGPFAFVDEDLAFFGGRAERFLGVGFSSQAVARLLEEQTLGPSIKGLAPSAERDAAIQAVCGRCPQCGSDRRPTSAAGRWLLSCERGHAGAEIDRELLTKIVDAGGLRCDKCQAPAVVRAGRYGPFVSCPTYRTCGGKAPQLKDVF